MSACIPEDVAHFLKGAGSELQMAVMMGPVFEKSNRIFEHLLDFDRLQQQPRLRQQVVPRKSIRVVVAEIERYPVQTQRAQGIAIDRVVSRAKRGDRGRPGILKECLADFY